MILDGRQRIRCVFFFQDGVSLFYPECRRTLPKENNKKIICVCIFMSVHMCTFVCVCPFMHVYVCLCVYVLLCDTSPPCEVVTSCYTEVPLEGWELFI